MRKMKGAYVYAITVDGVPRYIGKGTKERALSHLREVHSISRRKAAGAIVSATTFHLMLTDAWEAGADIKYDLIEVGLSSRHAFALEACLIETTPGLWNERRSAGMTDHQRRNHLAAVQSKQWRDRQSVAQKAIWTDPDYRALCLGALARFRQTPEASKVFSDATRKDWADPVRRAQRSAAIRAAKKVQHAEGMPAKMLAFITEHNGVSHKEICDHFGLTLLVAKGILSRLRRRGEIMKSGSYHAGRFYPTAGNVVPLTKGA